MNNYYDYFPFESFNELKEKIKIGEAQININYRGSMSSIAQRKSPIMAILFWAGPIFGITTLILFSKNYIGNYWLLLFTPFLIVSSSWPAIFNIKFLLTLNFILWIVPFIFDKLLWIAGIGLSSLIANISYIIWYVLCDRIAVDAVLNNEDLFYDLWNKTHITIAYNNNYYLASTGTKITNIINEIDYCRNCGEKLSKEEKFCHKCGMKI